MVRILSFEGEVEDKSGDGNLNIVEPPGDGNSNIVEPQRVIEPPEADYGRGKRIRKETVYVKACTSRRVRQDA